MPDLGGVGDVGAAAELARDVLDLDHPHPVAVLLAEQRHRAELLGLVARHLHRADRAGSALIHSLTRSSTSRASLGAERGAVGEVEAELVGAHRRAGLAHVGPEQLAQRGVQQVGGGVVAHRRVAGACGRPRPRPRVPGLRRLAVRLQRQRLVVADPVDVGDLRLAALPAHAARSRRPGRRPRRRRGSPRASRARGRRRARPRARWSRRGASRSRRSATAAPRRRRPARRRGGPRSRGRSRSRPGRARAAPPSAPRSPGRRPTGPPRRAAPWSGRRGSRRCRGA